jgi:hypothetical protein
LTNGKEVFDDVRSEKDIVEAKGARKNGVSSTQNWKGGSFAHDDGGKERSGRG